MNVLNINNKKVFLIPLDEKYMIGFGGYIYNDRRDGDAFQKVIIDLLKPKIIRPFGGIPDMIGSFVKDKILVETCWHECYDYFWEIYTNDSEIAKKVYEWAVRVYDEYIRQNGNK